MLASLFSLFYVTGEFHGYLYRSRASVMGPRLSLLHPLTGLISQYLYWFQLVVVLTLVLL